MTHDNSVNDTRAKDLTKKVKELGAAEGAGVNSRVELASQVISAVQDGVIAPTPAKKGDAGDVASLWTTYQQARAGRANGMSDAAPTSANSFKVQVSKLTAFAKFGALTAFDPAVEFHRAKVLLSKVEGVKGSSFDNMLDYCRKQAASPVPLSDAEILGIWSQDEEAKVKPAKPEIVQIRDALERLSSIEKGSDPSPTSEGRAPAPSPQLATAIKAITDRLGELEAMEEAAKRAAGQAQANLQREQAASRGATIASSMQGAEIVQDGESFEYKAATSDDEDAIGEALDADEVQGAEAGEGTPALTPYPVNPELQAILDGNDPLLDTPAIEEVAHAASEQVEEVAPVTGKGKRKVAKVDAGTPVDVTAALDAFLG